MCVLLQPVAVLTKDMCTETDPVTVDHGTTGKILAQTDPVTVDHGTTGKILAQCTLS